MRANRRLFRLLLPVLAAGIVLPYALSAQEPATALSTSAAAGVVTAQSPDGFLFRAPRVTLGMRAGYNMPRAGSGLFDFATEQLTLESNDFRSFAVAGDVGVTLVGPLDLVFSAGYAATSKRSEFREYTDQDDLPITQRTTFSQTPLTVALRAYLLPRGRQIGRFAWVPARFAPYVGAGGGTVHYTFRQVGSFVDFVDLSIFEDTIESDGWTGLGMVMAGADLSISPRVGLNADARYQFASGELDREFVSFTDGIDLNGLQLSMGVHFRF
jgi:hypothetical protein